MKMGVGNRMLVVIAAAAIPLAALSLQAQEPKAAKTAAGKGYDPARRVPPYFAKVGLSAEQREAIYKIRGQHLERIEALKQQIEKLEAQIMTESEAVLTDEQRRQLESERATAKEKSKTKAKTKAKATATDKASGPAPKSGRSDG